jgi:PAS domain S-box-containing protein
MNPTLASGTFSSEINSYNLFMQAPALICILDGRAGKCILSNPGFTKLFGGRELLGRTPREVAPELEGQGYFEMLEAVFDTGQPVSANEYPGIADWEDNGHPYLKYFNLVYTPYRTNGRITGVMIFGIEVTEQVKARELVQASETQFRQLADFIPQIVWTASPDGTVNFLNKKWYDFIGTEFISFDRKDLVHPDDLPLYRKAWKHSLDTGEPYEIEFRFIDKKLEEGYRWFLIRALPIKDEKGNITKWLGTCTDIHDTKSENRRLEEEVTKRTAELIKVANDLALSNRDLEHFAAIASHDLKAPLRKITTYVSAISAKQKDVDKELLNYLSKIERTATDMNTLVGNLLDYSKVSAGTIIKTTVDLNKIIKDAISELEVHLNESKGRISTDKNLPVVRGEPLQLKRLFTNLLSNSIKFTRKDIPPEIVISFEKTEERVLTNHGLDPSRNYFSIHIADNGIGFEKEYSEKIFELFTRLNPGKLFEGTGLGLSICKRIAANHEGKIVASPGATEGAIFTILLPE